MKVQPPVAKRRQASERKTGPDSTGRTIRKYAQRLGRGLGAWTNIPGADFVGDRIGNLAGGFISRITGHGKYTIQKNEVWEGNATSTFTNAGDGIIIAHREFVTDLSGSVNFSLQSFALQPTNSTLFPFLSTQALYYENWELLGAVVEYVPTSGYPLAGASPAAGVVILATEYNPNAPPFISKQQMETYEYCTSAAPFEQQLHPIECARTSNPLPELFTRTTTVPGASLPLYDMGTLYVATQGMPAVYTIGELWITYKVRLRKPRVPATVGSYYHIRSDNSSTNTNILAGMTVMAATGSYLTPPVTTSVNTITFVRAGTYFFSLAAQGTGAITTGPLIASGAGNALISAYGATNQFSQIGVQVGTWASLFCMITATAGSSVVLGGMAGLTGGLVDVQLVAIPAGLTQY